MSRAAKATFIGSILVSGLTVWGVHYMQVAERATMYKGVERDEARQAAKRAQRQADLEANQQREAEFQKMQPTKNYVAHSPLEGRQYIAHSVVEDAEKAASSLKKKAGGALEAAGLGDDEDRRYIAWRWGLNGLELAAVAATPFYLFTAARRGGFSLKRLARTNFSLPAAGGLAGYGGGYVYAQTLDPTTAATKSLAYRHDRNAIKRDDHYIIGAAVGGLLLPALALGRTGLLAGLAGGSLGLGGTAGMTYDMFQSYSGAPGSSSSSGVKLPGSS